MLRRLRKRIPAAPPREPHLPLPSTVLTPPNPNLLPPSLLSTPNPLSSLLPPSLNPSATAVDLIVRRLNHHPAAATLAAPPLSPAESHLLPHLGPSQICQIILKTQSKPLSSLHFFNWARSVLDPASIPPRSYFLLAHILTHSNFFSSAMAVLSELVLSTSCDHFHGLLNPSEHCNRNPAIFGMLIKVYSKLNKLDHAVNTLTKIFSHGFPITADDINSLLNALSKSNRHDQCWEIYDKMKKSGIPSNCYTFNILTGVLCKSGAVCKFEDFMAEMEIYGFDPDVVTYNTLINGFCKRERIEEAMNLYRIMSIRGVEPDLITYTSLIRGLGREGRSKDARNLFDTMHLRGIVPDNHAYNALICCFCEEGKISEGKKLLKEMIQSGLKPDKFTCNAFFEGYVKREKMLSFLNILVQLRRYGGERIVSSKIYKTLIGVLCRERKPTAARSLFILFMEDGYKPNLEIYSQLIQSFWECGFLDEGLEIEEEMVGCGLAPDWAMYASLVKCLCKRGRIEEAERRVRKMCRCRAVPSSEACVALVEGFCEKREYGEAERVMREMAEEFGVVDVKGFNVLIEAYAAQGEVRKSIELQERMLQLGVTPNGHTCRLLIHGLVQELEMKSGNV